MKFFLPPIFYREQTKEKRNRKEYYRKYERNNRWDGSHDIGSLIGGRIRKVGEIIYKKMRGQDGKDIIGF